ncbi:MAG TPA: Ig-like domain-containing domain [Gemmatimonadaceae bacterium]|nr:Ig-like domain-containing domain [Gemmatimonadaceae bacterium]
MRRLIAVALLVSACASPGMPPGGPPDVAAPQIVKIIPDSGAVGVKPKEVLFRFDEVVSERASASGSLGDLFLISPRNGATDASWHRDAIGVKPSRGWRANTPYTVIMLRGVADIRGNVRNTGATTFFSTGSVIPHTRIAGTVFDWVSGSPAAGALVESFVPPDSLHPFVALADSNGAFVIEHVPPGSYTTRAYVDRNKNLAIDPSEPWDSTSLSLADSVRTTLVIFTHDTVPPRIREVVKIDSLTLRVAFDKPVDPAQTLTAANFAIVAPDSSRVPIASAGPPPKDTTPAVSPAPSITGPVRPPPPNRRDTTPVVPKPIMPRPIPINDVVITLQHPLTPKLVYRVRATGIRGLLGRAGDSDRPYTAPEPPPPLAPAPKPGPVTPASPPPVKP